MVFIHAACTGKTELRNPPVRVAAVVAPGFGGHAVYGVSAAPTDPEVTDLFGNPVGVLVDPMGVEVGGMQQPVLVQNVPGFMPVSCQPVGVVGMSAPPRQMGPVPSDPPPPYPGLPK